MLYPASALNIRKLSLFLRFISVMKITKRGIALGAIPSLRLIEAFKLLTKCLEQIYISLPEVKYSQGTV